MPFLKSSVVINITLQQILDIKKALMSSKGPTTDETLDLDALAGQSLHFRDEDTDSRPPAS